MARHNAAPVRNSLMKLITTPVGFMRRPGREMKRTAVTALAGTAGLAGGALGFVGTAAGAPTSTPAIQFSFTQSAMPKGFRFPTPNDGRVSIAYCQWPNGKT
jgi:hypothetical protein